MDTLLIVKLLRENFSDVFSCTRTWSAWSYETMVADDFVSLSDDEDLIHEIALELSQHKDIESFLEVFDNYKLYYNEDIYRNFHSIAFKDDWTQYYDLEEIFKELFN